MGRIMAKRIKVAVPWIGKEEIKTVLEVLKSGYYVSGPNVEKFERAFAKYIKVKEAVACNSGTSAIHLVLAALGIGTGDEVIVPALTFFSTVTAVIHNNGIPVFADIDSDIYCLDPLDIEDKITEKTKAIIPVHLYGHPAEMDAINKIAKRHGLYVIEDCAQAHGAEYRGRKVGSLGHAGCWSFFATKNMTVATEGGMITLNDSKLADKMRKIRSHGMVNRNDHAYLGYNYRMNEIAGAIGRVQLTKLDMFNRLRNEHSMYLRRKLRGIPWLKIPPIKPYIKHAWFWCPIQIREEVLGMSTWDLRKLLQEKGMETRHRYNEPLYKQSMLNDKFVYPRGCPFSCPHSRRIDYKSINLPNVEKIAGKMLGLPNHPRLTKKERGKIVKIIRQI